MLKIHTKSLETLQNPKPLPKMFSGYASGPNHVTQQKLLLHCVLQFLTVLLEVVRFQVVPDLSVFERCSAGTHNIMFCTISLTGLLRCIFA